MSRHFRVTWTDDVAAYVDQTETFKEACSLVENVAELEGCGALCEAKFVDGKPVFTYYNHCGRTVFIIEEVFF